MDKQYILIGHGHVGQRMSVHSPAVMRSVARAYDQALDAVLAGHNEYATTETDTPGVSYTTVNGYAGLVVVELDVFLKHVREAVDTEDV